jgi:hypothetical protein
MYLGFTSRAPAAPPLPLLPVFVGLAVAPLWVAALVVPMLLVLLLVLVVVVVRVLYLKFSR